MKSKMVIPGCRGTCFILDKRAPLKKTGINGAKALTSTLAMNLRLYKVESIAVIALAIISVALFVGWLALSSPTRRSNQGFGPDWDCNDIGKPSAQVCIKNSFKKND